MLVRAAVVQGRAGPSSSFRSVGANPRIDVLGKQFAALWSARLTSPTVTGPDALERAKLPEKDAYEWETRNALARGEAVSKDFYCWIASPRSRFRDGVDARVGAVGDDAITVA